MYGLPLGDCRAGAHLQPRARAEHEARVGDAAVVEQRHAGVQPRQAGGRPGGQHLECVGGEDGEHGQHRLQLRQPREQRAELRRATLQLQEVRLLPPRLKVGGQRPALLVPADSERGHFLGFNG